jgi:hypothetical protein
MARIPASQAVLPCVLEQGLRTDELNLERLSGSSRGTFPNPSDVKARLQEHTFRMACESDIGCIIPTRLRLLRGNSTYSSVHLGGEL